MKRLTLTGLALFFVATLSAQVEDDWTGKVKESNESAFKEYEQFKQQAYQDYLSFRRQANEEFAKFMEESWKMYDIQPAEEPPAKPKPVTPMVDNTVPTKPEPKPTLDPEPKLEPETEPEPKPEPEIKPEPEPKLEPEPEPVLEPEPKPEPEPEPKPEPAPEQNTNVRQAVAPVRIPDPIQVQDLSKPELMLTGRPQPVEPIVPSAVPMVAAQNVYLYGSSFAFHIDSEPTLSLKDASEKSVAKMWKQLSDPSFDYIIAECLQQRDKRQLCDWAYIKLTQSVAEKQFGAGTNEAVVMQMYLLTQSGYQMRIGRDDANRLALLIGSKEKIYYYKYFMLNGMKFYLIDRSFNKKGLSIFDHAFPKERSLSLAMIQPDLQIDKTEKRTIKSKRYPNVSVTVQTNRNLISFYNEYPMSAMWNYYSLASLSDVVKETLYPALRQAIKGKTELEAANILLNFVQTGFEYKTDDEQFGYERPLYPDESLFYPYCDCEDRSILFSCLIRELLGLDVVLLNYPEHLATAVSFNEEVKGDYLVIDGKSYIICDPTYINASVGNCAPKYKTVSPAIVRF